MTRPRIIAVLGMHRSGTSAMARGLKALGVELGENLMPAVEGNNDKGFWEDMDFYKFNVRLMAKAGNSWDRLSLIDVERLIREEYSAERYEAAGLIERKMGDAKLFGFKDPRTSVLLPFWRCIFEDLGIDDNYLIALRNPLEVAESLKKRDKLHFNHSLMLWLKYTYSAVQHSEGRKRICVSYQSLINDPAPQLNRIATAFGLPMPSRNSPEYSEYAEEFLTPSLRHNRISANELARYTTIPKVIPQLYTQLSDWSDAGPDEDISIPAKLKSQIDIFWNSNATTLALSDQLRSDAVAVTAKLAQSEKANSELAKQVELLKNTQAQLQKDLADAKDQLSAKAKRIVEREIQVTELEEKSSKAQSQLAAATTDLESKAAVIANQTDRIHKLESERAQLETARAESHDAAQIAKQTIEQHKARIAELQQALTAARDGAAKTHAELDKKMLTIAELADRIGELEAKKSQTEQALHSAREEADKRNSELKALKTDFEGAIAKAQERIEAIEAEAASTNRALAERTKELRLFRESAADQRDAEKAAKSELQTKLQEAQDHIRSVEAEAASLQAALAEKTKDLRLVRHDAADQREAGKAEELRLKAKLEEQKKHAESTITGLRDEIAKNANKLSMVTQEASDLQSTLSRMEQQLKNQTLHVSGLKTRLHHLETDLRTSRNALEGAQKTIVEMQADLLEKTKTTRLLRHEVLELRSSTSWKITKPLRLAGSLLTSPKQVFTRLSGTHRSEPSPKGD